jgi:hypothetical protein
LNGNSTIHARLLLCDAIKQGFCNPLHDTRETEKSLQPVDTDLDADPESTWSKEEVKKDKYKEGNTLLGVDDGPIVSSCWIKWTLKEISPDSPAYKTSADITFRLTKGIRQGISTLVVELCSESTLPMSSPIM